MKLIKLISIFITVCSIAACASKQNLDYLNARNGKNLVVNAPLSSKEIDREYYLASVGKIKAQSIEPPV